MAPPRLRKRRVSRRSRSDRFHSWDQADVRAANGTLSTCKIAGRSGCGAAAVILRAIEAHAGTTRDADLLGHGLVAWHFFLDGFDKTTLAAWNDNLLGHDVIFASLHLASFRAVAGVLASEAEHRAAGREAERNGDQRDEQNEVFHGVGFVGGEGNLVFRKGSSKRRGQGPIRLL